MDLKTSSAGIYSPLLKPKTMSGLGMEYTLGDESLVITNFKQMDPAKRRLEVPWESLERFISELQEIEQLVKKDMIRERKVYRHKTAL